MRRLLLLVPVVAMALVWRYRLPLGRWLSDDDAARDRIEDEPVTAIPGLS